MQSVQVNIPMVHTEQSKQCQITGSKNCNELTKLLRSKFRLDEVKCEYYKPSNISNPKALMGTLQILKTAISA